MILPIAISKSWQLLGVMGVSSWEMENGIS
jgi:hypothetical protein